MSLPSPVIQLFERLTHPLASNLTDEEHSQIRLAASLMLFQVGAALALGIGWMIYSLLPVGSETTTAVVLWLMLVGIYLLARTRYYRLAVILNVVAVFLYVAYLYLSVGTPSPELGLVYLTLPMLVVSLVLSLPTTISVIVLMSVAPLGLAVLRPYPDFDAPGATAYLLTVGGLILTATWLRERMVARLRKQQQRLRVSEARYRSLMEANFELIIIYDEQGIILDANQAVETLLGRRPTELIGSPLSDLIAEQHRPSFTQHEKSGNFNPFELQFLTRDNQSIDMEVICRPHSYRDHQANVCIGRDITARKEADQMRRENEQRYQALFQNLTDAVFIISMDGHVIAANERAVTMLERPMESIIGYAYQNFMIETQPNDLTTTMTRLRRGNLLPVYQRQFKRGDGSEFTGEVSAMLVRDSAGQPRYVQKIVRDVTFRQQVERQRMDLTLHQERLNMLRNFITDISHHFRTPLTNLKTSLYLMERLQDNPTRRQAKLDTMRHEVARLEDLLEDLLMIARTEKEERQIGANLAPMALNPLLKSIVDRVRSSEPEDKHHWHFVPAPGNPIIRGDSAFLGEALLKLLENAVRYTPEGGTVGLRTYVLQNDLVVEIYDTGMGIHEQDLPHIFDSFYRSDSARDIQHASSGLGLTIADRIVRLHGGRIEVNSRPEHGSIFRVVLPPFLATDSAVGSETSSEHL